MIGPRTKQMPDKIVCTDCEVVISKKLGGTPRFRKTWLVHYCKHSELSTEVAFIKGFPYTPKWCPALKGRNLTSKCSGREYSCSCSAVKRIGVGKFCPDCGGRNSRR